MLLFRRSHPSYPNSPHLLDMMQSALLPHVYSLYANLGSRRSNPVAKFNQDHVNVVNYELAGKASPCPQGY